MNKIYSILSFVLVLTTSIHLSAQISTSSQWTWLKGGPGFSNASYGVKSVSASSNTPGSRYHNATWSGLDGKLYTYGGAGLDINGSNGSLADMWQYDPANNMWTWIQGSTLINQSPIYGTKGAEAVNNTPGSRMTPAFWQTADGNFWLYGGSSNVGSSIYFYSDLWRFNPSTNMWAWISGNANVNQTGYYTTLGVAAPENNPGSRDAAQYWTDKSGNIWLFGGYNGTTSALNDLWMYNTSTGYWTALQNSTTGYYSNKPAPRYHGFEWTDNAGNLWLFGGYGTTSQGNGSFADVWKYTISTNQWLLVKGDGMLYASAQYGNQGIEAISNTPGGRYASKSWTDEAGFFWFMGGYKEANGEGYYNDLWKYNPASNSWTWIKGDNFPYAANVYGVQGAASPDNKPGGRHSISAWYNNNQLWILGGYSSTTPRLNDLWRLGFASPQPTTSSVKVNIYGGTNPYTNGEWNNWNVSASLNSGPLNYAANAGTSTINAVLSKSSGINDNGATYGSGMAPAEVLRYASNSTTVRTLTLSGLNATKKYSLELYGSRNASSGQSTLFTIYGASQTIATYKNLTDRAFFSNLNPNTANQIVVTIQNLNAYSYLNGFVLTETSDNNDPNAVPTVTAGPDQTIILPLNNVTLNGAATDADGSIAKYSWSKISGPSQFSFSSRIIPNPTVGNLEYGDYVFRLTATDDKGATRFDDVQISISNALPPAGTKLMKVNIYGGVNPYNSSEWNDWNVAASITTSRLTYSNEDESAISAVLSKSSGINDNGVAYGSGMAPAEVLRYASSSNTLRTLTLKGLAANKTYSLEVFASRNNTGNSTVFSMNEVSVTIKTDKNLTTKVLFSNLSVNAQGELILNIKNVNGWNYINGFILTEKEIDTATNLPPVAYAGGDQSIILPATNTTLSGSGTDGDGSISNYNWTKVSGPSQFALSNPNAAATTVSGLVQGTYIFRLTVTDNAGVTATDEVQVSVKDAPITKTIKVNLFGGVNPYNNAEWNNWNVVSSLNSGFLKYPDAAISTINAVLTQSNGALDNGATYGGTMAPPEVLRYTSSSSVQRTLTLNGLDPAKRYSIELYASRNNTGNSTQFTVNGVAVTVLTDKNKTNIASFVNLIPSASGQIVVTLKDLNTYNYLNGFVITETSNAAETGALTSSTLIETNLKTNTNSSISRTGLGVYPNPSSEHFNLLVNNNSHQPVRVQITDATGRTIEVLRITASDKAVAFGHGYKAGVYYVVVIIGTERKIVQAIKM